ncbi:adenylate/guanylate cyclase domain-containing protein [Geomonas limicola]|uniref:Adenylate/guanylate cyclase domain-containing protein n=1 Tax=Geomonas limicola TaxID=2740186 RepID=A0A6V8N6L1_9BACT|nr:adenylate/guanylate cyclase domain-containing protein [Geomonas limicola]GFO67990.1 adenylate/guanylate cyclase domain-containing protein [Geomonas limicola]
MKKHLPFYLIASLSLAASLLVQVYDPPIIRDHLEAKTYDLRLHLRQLFRPPPVSPRIVIVTIDDRSIAELGRWPWSRQLQARLIDRIAAGKPKAIGIDLLYSEPENPQSDAALAGALKRAGNVVQGTAFRVPAAAGGSDSGTADAAPTPPDALWDAAFAEVKSVPGIAWKRWAVAADQVSLPVGEIPRTATLGHVVSIPDLDGVLRWDLLYLRFGDDCYPSFALQLARIAAGIPANQAVLYGGSGIKLGERFLKTDLSGRVLINYRGPEASFPVISAADLISGRQAPETVKDRIVLVGTSALATFDQKVTPLSANCTGVEKNATVVQNLLENDFLAKSPGVVELAMILVSGLALMLALPRLKAQPGVALGVLFTAGYFLFAQYLLIERNTWINLVAPVGNLAVIVTAAGVSRLFFEERQARQIRAMFSSYVTERLVDEMIRNPGLARLGGERREITVLFSDVKGFTSYAERHSPEEVVAILNEYLGEMTEIVLRWEGILDKFIGDAIVAFWGAPHRQEDHAERAVRCALEMQARLEELGHRWREAGRVPLEAGIGINTGEAIVGNIGAEGKKMDYTVIGDQVNLGARVESLTRRYGEPILVTEYTVAELRRAVSDGAFKGVAFQGLERVAVKGKEQPVALYAVHPLDDQRGEPVIVELRGDAVVRLDEK